MTDTIDPAIRLPRRGMVDPPAANPASQAVSRCSGVVAPAPTVALRIDRARLRRFDVELMDRLRADGVRVSLHPGRCMAPMPAPAELLLQLERLAYRLKGLSLWERVSPDELDIPPAPRDDGRFLMIDLCGDAAAPEQAGHVLRILYDGVAGETALIGALLANRMPAVEIVDACDYTVLARGVACADNARTLSEALECVLARVLVLVTAAIRGERPLATARIHRSQSVRSRDLAAFELKALAGLAVSRLYHLCCYAPHWRTLWRFVSGPDLWDLKTLRGTAWNVIPDPGHHFYADPFPFTHEGQAFVFVEDLDHRTNKGIISVIPFDRNGPTGPARPVLEEPWHLSYPFLIARDGQIWMVPESSANNAVTLYRADPFPYRWVPEATLLSGVQASDATIINHGGLFWMFAATRDGRGSWSDTLSIWWARDLRGPWIAHVRSPVLIDQAAARPAGAMVMRNGRLWRPVQDCTHGYGTGVGLAEVTVLDQQRFEQKVDAVLRAEPDWPGRRFHTLNRAGSIECIDGAAYSPRSEMLARRFEARSGRREGPPRWR